MSTEDISIHVFCLVDDQMPEPSAKKLKTIVLICLVCVNVYY